MEKWDILFEQHLVEAYNYRNFLKFFFTRNGSWQHPKSLSFRNFADRAGFSSKSFLSEIISGKKKITPGSFDKIAAGLKLNKYWRDYFFYLVAVEEPQFYNKTHGLAYFQKRLSVQRKKILGIRQDTWSEHQSGISHRSLKENYTDICVSINGSGSTFEEIKKISRIGDAQLTKELHEMVFGGDVSFNKVDKKYRYLSQVQNYGHSYSSAEYQAYFSAAIEKAKSRMGKAKPEGLYVTQTFRVKRKELADMRSSLAELIRDFADEADADVDGDGIAEICVMLSHNFD